MAQTDGLSVKQPHPTELCQFKARTNLPLLAVHELVLPHHLVMLHTFLTAAAQPQIQLRMEHQGMRLMHAKPLSRQSGTLVPEMTQCV